MVETKRGPFLALQQNQQKQLLEGRIEKKMISSSLHIAQQGGKKLSSPPLSISIAEPGPAVHTRPTSSLSKSLQPTATLRPRDERRTSHTSSVQTATESSPSSSSSAGLESASSRTSATAPRGSSGTFRKSSFFRMGRKPFGRKKDNQDKTTTPNAEVTNSFESQRSRPSLSSLTGWSGKSSTSRSDSPVLFRDASSLPAPMRESMSSYRTGGSTSDIDGNRISSDLESIGRGNGKMTWGRNRSSISLLGDSIKEGVGASHRLQQSGGRLSLSSSGVLEMDESGPSHSAKTRPPLNSRLQAQRSSSSSSIPQWNDTGSIARLTARTASCQSSPGSPGGTRKKAGLVTPSAFGRLTDEQIPPTFETASVFEGSYNEFELQRVSRTVSLMGNSVESPSAVHSKGRKSSMNVVNLIDDEIDSSFRRAKQIDIQPLLGSSKNDTQRRPSQQESLEVPGSVGGSRGILRKTRSQSSFILSRRPSFLGGNKKTNEESVEDDKQQRVASLPQFSSKEGKARLSPKIARPMTSGSIINGTASGKSSPVRLSPSNSRSKRSPLDKVFASRQQKTDSSPETEYKHQPFFAFARWDRSNSASSMDKQNSSLTKNNKAAKSRNGSMSANASRPSSPLSASRLDTNGGVATLFGTSSSTPRQRASSLLPSLQWRPRATSNADRLFSSSTNDSARSSSSDIRLSLEKETGKDRGIVKVDASEFDGDAGAFVQYVLANVPRSDYSAVFASSADEIHRQALQLYMRQFYFAGIPLDIALRKLLMSVCLPKETQQIDRVMEAFARRYNECNESLFFSDDQPYVLAFSLMMLHTDAFNKNAKQKMTKQDYLRNTISSGVRDEILEYLYDNLTFTQFIYVEDDEAITRRKKENEPPSSGSFLSAFSTSTNSASKNRIDPYYIIATGQTFTLRADIARFISEDSPFSAKGTAASYEIEALNRSFVNAPSIEIVTTLRPSLPAVIAMGSDSLSTSLGATEKEQETVVTLRITKIGLISRKDDIFDDNKKVQSRKWKTCGMMLSSSQLLFFKDLVWTTALHQQIKEQTNLNHDQEGNILITPRITYFRPDGVLALGDAIAVQDTSNDKYVNVLRLIARQGDQSRHYLIQSANEVEMNDWIHKINFCAAFRASGLRIRDLDSLDSLDIGDNGSTKILSSEMSTLIADGDNDKRSSKPPFSTRNEASSTSTGVPSIRIMSNRSNARRKEVLSGLRIAKSKHQDCKTELEEALRFARHLGILTPFMKVTRDRIETTAIILSHRIRALRLDVSRYGSRVEILQLELQAGDGAARAMISASPFSEDVFSEERSQSELLPSAIVDKDGFLRVQQQIDADLDEGNLATPRVHTITIGEEHQNKVTPALGIRQYPSPPPSSATHHTRSDEVSLDDLLAQELDAPLFLDYQDYQSGLSPHSAPPSTTRVEIGRNSSHSPPPLHSRRHNKHSIPREEAERWDRSKVVTDSKRVSLVTLPDAEHLKNLARLSMNHTMNNSIEERIE